MNQVGHLSMLWVIGRCRKGLSVKAGIYCYEDSALSTFQAAARTGVKRYYELPIIYWQTVQRLLREEAERSGDAGSERQTGALQLADLVICPSRQVQQSLPHEPLVWSRNMGVQNRLVNALRATTLD